MFMNFIIWRVPVLPGVALQACCPGNSRGAGVPRKQAQQDLDIEKSIKGVFFLFGL